MVGLAFLICGFLGYHRIYVHKEIGYGGLSYPSLSPYKDPTAPPPPSPLPPPLPRLALLRILHYLKS